MRHIGTLPGRIETERFVDYLRTLGIEAEGRLADAAHGIWIYSERDVPAAREELAAFVQAPNDGRYVEAAAEARASRTAEAVGQKVAAKRTIDVRSRWDARAAAPFTIALIATSVVVAMFTWLGERSALGDLLTIAGFRVDGDLVRWTGLQQVLRGQVWRLLTPIFLHGDFLHIAFNMFWLWELGTAIEARRGSLRFALLVLATAVGSNLGQYFWAGPQFGGMSGVVYGLFGYIWMHGRLHPRADMQMPENTVVWMIGWFVLCLTGALGPIANAAHGVGLAIGMAAGALPALLHREVSR